MDLEGHLSRLDSLADRGDEYMDAVSQLPLRPRVTPERISLEVGAAKLLGRAAVEIVLLVPHLPELLRRQK